MKRHGYLFDRIVDKDNLRKAHRNARRGKSKYKEVKLVDENVEYYIDKIQKMLIDGTFTTSDYEVFTKNDKGKSREIYKLPYFPDRIVQHALMQVMEPIWKGMLIKQTYQSIKGRGVHKALKDLRVGLTPGAWITKVDIQKYYPSIDNDKLYEMLVKKVKCVRTKELIKDIVYSIQGVPIGNYTSQYFGNVYLSEFDRELRKDCKVYSRYCDDVVCITKDKIRSKALLKQINGIADELRLVVKRCQQVWNIQHRCIDYLGYVVWATHTLVRPGIANGYTKAVAKADNDKINGYGGWLVHVDCHNLTRRTNENNYKC